MSTFLVMLDEAWFQDRLRARQDEGLLRSLTRTLQSAPGPRVQLQGGSVLNFASNNYLGLSTHPEISRAAASAAETWGGGATGSRLLGGDLALHHQTEERLRLWKHAGAALLFNGGYAANVGILAALCDEHTELFLDRLDHASLVDGARLSGARLHRYRHNDLADLASLLAKYPGRQVIATESIFSMDGDMAPLGGIVELAEQHGALVVVDEAHADGVFGPAGRGLVHALGLEARVDVVMGTMGKALGSYGAAVWCAPIVRDWLINNARSFIYSTALPPATLGSICAAIELCTTAADLRAHLSSLAKHLRTSLQALGFDTLQSASQIIPIVLGSNERVLTAANFLLQRGILAPAIRHPTVPQGSARLRLNLMATHTLGDVNEVIAALAEFRTTHPEKPIS